MDLSIGDAMTCELKKILLVDDEQDLLRKLERAFEVASNEDFSFEIHKAKSVEEYFKLSEQIEFDAAVVDIQLDSAQEGIDTIVSYHHIRWPGTIIIVFSGFPPGVDAIRTVVQAMKLGSLDCIEKHRSKDTDKIRFNPRHEDYVDFGGSSPLDLSIGRVVRAVIRELESQNRKDLGPSADWLSAHFDDLKKKYGGKAVAFLGNDVVCIGESIADVRKGLTQQQWAMSPYFMVIPLETANP